MTMGYLMRAHSVRPTELWSTELCYSCRPSCMVGYISYASTGAWLGDHQKDNRRNNGGCLWGTVHSVNTWTHSEGKKPHSVKRCNWCFSIRGVAIGKLGKTSVNCYSSTYYIYTLETKRSLQLKGHGPSVKKRALTTAWKKNHHYMELHPTFLDFHPSNNNLKVNIVVQFIEPCTVQILPKLRENCVLHYWGEWPACAVVFRSKITERCYCRLPSWRLVKCGDYCNLRWNLWTENHTIIPK